MRAWWELYKKELYTIGFFSMVVLLLVLAWELFLFYKMDTWPAGVNFGLSFLPFSFFPFLILWMGYNSYRQEWRDDTNYFILSLPRRGWEISLAKLAASMTFYLGITLFTVVLIYLFYQGVIVKEIISEIPKTTFAGILRNFIIGSLLFYWIGALYVYIITQFSQLVSLFFDRFRGLVSVIVFILSQYLVFRGASILAPLFKWFPDIPIKSFGDIGMGIPQKFTIYIGSGPIISLVLVVIGFFILGSWILENQLEV